MGRAFASRSTVVAGRAPVVCTPFMVFLRGICKCIFLVYMWTVYGSQYAGGGRSRKLRTSRNLCRRACARVPWTVGLLREISNELCKTSAFWPVVRHSEAGIWDARYAGICRIHDNRGLGSAAVSFIRSGDGNAAKR